MIDKKRRKALIRVNTERILYETGELSSRDLIFKLERQYRLKTTPHSLHQILRPHTRIERGRTRLGTNYRLIERNA